MKSEISELKVACTGSAFVDYRGLLDLQDGLKATNVNKIERLADSLIRFGLVNPLQVWVSPTGETYCFDAHHRKKALESLEQRGISVPKLPATYCIARDITEARTLLLAKESTYSWIDTTAVEGYLDEIGLSLDLGAEYFELPALDFSDTGGRVYFDDEAELPSGEIEEREALIKVSLFCSVDIKKDFINDLRNLEIKYGSDRVKLV